MNFVFIHIHKTAGTTFCFSYLPAAFDEGKKFVLRGFKKENREDLDYLVDNIDSVRKKVRVIAGHNTEYLRPHLPEGKYLTLVRNPIERAVSAYLHARYHPDAYDVRGKYIKKNNISLSTFVEQDLSANLYRKSTSVHDFQSRIILNLNQINARPSDEDILRAIRHNFYIVGFTEKLEQFIFLLHITDNFPLILFNNRLVRRERWPFRPTKSDIETIKKYNQLDLRVYDIAKKEFQRQIDRRLRLFFNLKYRLKHARYLSAIKKFRDKTSNDENIFRKFGFFN